MGLRDRTPPMPEDITTEFAHADINDLRRVRRLDQVVAALAKAPAASIPAASGGWKETLAASRLRNCEDIRPAALIAPHHEATTARCS
jgi:hypothetical protein